MKREVVCLNRRIELREVEDGRRYVSDGSLIDFYNRKTGEHEYFKCKRSKNIGNLIKIEKEEFTSLSSDELETKNNEEPIILSAIIPKDLSRTVLTDEEAKKIYTELKESKTTDSVKVDTKKGTSKFLSSIAGKFGIGANQKKEIIIAIESNLSRNLDDLNRKLFEKFPNNEYNLFFTDSYINKLSTKWEGLDALYNLIIYCANAHMIYFTRGSLYEKKWILLREIADAYGIPYEIENTID